MTQKRTFEIPSRQLTDHHMATNWFSWIIDGGEPPPAPCLPPRLAEFRVRFPEFQAVLDDTVAQSIAEAACIIDSSWITETGNCSNCTLAISYLAAHYLALGLMSAQVVASLTAKESSSSMEEILAGGQVTSMRFENMGISFSAPKFAAGQGGGGGPNEGPYELEMTPYGQRYLALLKVNQPAIMVV
jgi:hypothetical protein